MKNFIEGNFIAGADIAEGDILYFDASTATVKPISAATQHCIGVAGQAVDAGCAVNIHSFISGTAFYVAVSETVTAGAALGIGASGGVIVDDGTASEKPLPLIAMEAKTISSGTDLVQCLCADVRAANA